MVKKILVVDDNDDIKLSIQFGLEKLDSSINVVSVENGKKCFEYLHENRDTDLIVLDIMMPGMNGW
jgi:CheY-like chemotaxis protein